MVRAKHLLKRLRGVLGKNAAGVSASPKVQKIRTMCFLNMARKVFGKQYPSQPRGRSKVSTMPSGFGIWYGSYTTKA